MVTLEPLPWAWGELTRVCITSRAYDIVWRITTSPAMFPPLNVTPF